MPNAGTRVVVVGGARRSGTTLVSAMLSSDPSTPPLPGEAQLLWRWVEAYGWAIEHPEIRVAPFFDDRNQLRTVYRRMLQQFVDHAASRGEVWRTIVLKSPELSLSFPLIRELFPYARFVVTVRDPRDQVASEWRVMQRRGSNHDQQVLNSRDVRAIAQAYVSYYAPILCALQDHPDGVMLQSFEQMVGDTSSALRRLESHTGLDLSSFDATLPWPRVADSYWAYGSSPSDTPYYGGKIRPERAGSYLESITVEESEEVMRVCQDTFSKLCSYFSDV